MRAVEKIVRVAVGTLFFAVIPVVCAEVLTFDASDDTFILPTSSGTRNGGGNEVIAAGPNSSTAGVVYRSLIRFDVSALGGQSGVIDEATLTFTHADLKKLAADDEITLNLFLLDNSNKDWVEGTAVYNVEDGSPCWAALAYDATSPTPWSGGEGIGNSTTSAGISAYLGSVTITNNDVAVGDTVSFSLPAAALSAIKSWSGGGDNAGFFLTTDEDDGKLNAVLLASDENADYAGPQLSVSVSEDDSVSFEPVDDNFIYNQTVYSNRNWGAYEQIAVGVNSSTEDWFFRGLLRFDLSTLQGQFASIDSATLTFVHDNVVKLSSDSNKTFAVNLLLLNNSNRDWIEGAGSDSAAETNESAWIYKAMPDGWTGGDGIGNSTASAGIDALAATATIVPTEVAVGDELVLTLNAAGLAALEAWAAGGENAGFLLVTDEVQDGVKNALLLASKENGTYAAPVLNVIYSAGYAGWAAGYGLASGTEADDADGDGLSNLAEYGLGGNPTNGIDRGYAMKTGLLQQAGTNWFEFVYVRRMPGSELTYTLQQCDDLPVGNWTNSGSYVETSGVLSNDFESVTNRFPIDEKSKEFIRLRIED